MSHKTGTTRCIGSYNLRSLSAPKLELGNKHDKGTFQDDAANIFNNLLPKLGTVETTYNFLVRCKTFSKKYRTSNCKYFGFNFFLFFVHITHARHISVVYI